jgi:hypothetical protein
MKNPVVFVVKEQVIRDEVGTVPIDYSPALKFGDLQFITSHDMPLHRRSAVQANWNSDVALFISQYNPKTDYIICTGQPMAIMTIGYLLGLVQKVPRYLVWRRQAGVYTPVEFGAEILNIAQ